jgi:transcriptional regulator with XRE-family HTH domain
MSYKAREPPAGRFVQTCGEAIERRSMTEGKTVRELREEIGLSLAELAEGMRVSERDLMLLESSGQKYLGLDLKWFALITEPYGYNKVFWYPPEKAVREREWAIGVLDALAMLADALDSEPLLAVLGDAIAGAREELDGCRDLRANFERQEEQIRFETVED